MEHVNCEDCGKDISDDRTARKHGVCFSCKIHNHPIAINFPYGGRDAWNNNPTIREQNAEAVANIKAEGREVDYAGRAAVL